MAVIRCNNLSLTFGSPPLLDGVQFTLESKERVCLVGRNGSGKSSFLKTIAGIYTPDGGQLRLEPDSKLEYLNQEVPQGIEGTVAEFLATPFEEAATNLRDYHLLLRKTDGDPTNAQFDFSTGGFQVSE